MNLFGVLEHGRQLEKHRAPNQYLGCLHKDLLTGFVFWYNCTVIIVGYGAGSTYKLAITLISDILYLNRTFILFKLALQ